LSPLAWVFTGLGLGITIGLTVAFFWLRHRFTSQLNKTQAFLSPLEAKRLVNEIENLEEQLAQARTNFHLVASHPASLVLTADENGFLTYVSPAVAKLTGFSPEELAVLHLRELFSPAAGERLANVMMRILKSDEADLSEWLTVGEALELKRQDSARVIVKAKIKSDAREQTKGFICQLTEVNRQSDLETRWEQQRQAMLVKISELNAVNQQANLLNRSFLSLLPNIDLANQAEALALCLNALRTGMGCTGVLVAALHENRMVITAQSGIQEAIVGRWLLMNDSNPFSLVLRTKQATAIDLGKVRLPDELYGLHQFPACFAIPLWRKDGVKGVLVLLDDSQISYSSQYIHYTSLYANLIALILSYSDLFEGFR
jgi:PAS domain S-box-containing protein